MKPASPLPIFVVCVVLFGGMGGYLHWTLLPQVRAARAELRSCNERLGRIEESIALLHFEGDPSGQPTDAVLEHLKFWTQRADQFGSSIAERPVIEQHMERAKKAMRALGAPAYASVEAVYREAAGKDSDARQFRKHLLRLLAELDPERAAELCLNELKLAGTDPQLRTLAAELLLDLAPLRAGTAIRNVLLTESSRGPKHTLPIGTQATAAHPGIRYHGFPGFYDLVSIYLRSRDAGKADVLLVMLNHSLNEETHDIPTLQEILKGLEEHGDATAAEPMKRLFSQTTSLTYRNPRLRQRCAQAVANLLRSGACTWLTDMLAQEPPTSPVATTLKHLLAQHCG